MEDDTYRQLLLAETGKSSTSEMPADDLDRVMRRMKRAGFRVRHKRGSRAQADDNTSKKIRALWLELHRRGKVRDPSEQALGRWVSRQTGLDALQFLNHEQSRQCIEALKKWLNRK